MSGLLKAILLTPSGGAAKLEYKKDANLFSAYNVDSSIPIEELTVQLTSTYVLCIEQKEYLTVSPASTYTLSTAVT